MLPAFLLIGFGKLRRPWVPIPLILFWPFWLLGWVLWPMFRLFSRRWALALRTTLVLGLHLSGTRIDVSSANGDHIHMRMV